MEKQQSAQGVVLMSAKPDLRSSAQKAIDACMRLWDERGVLILGFPEGPTSASLRPGDTVGFFMNYPLPDDCEILLTKRCSFAEWDEEAKFLGIRNPYKEQDGGLFFKAILVRRNGSAYPTRSKAAAIPPTRMEPQPIVPASSHRSDENRDPETEK